VALGDSELQSLLTVKGREGEGREGEAREGTGGVGREDR